MYVCVCVCVSLFVSPSYDLRTNRNSLLKLLKQIGLLLRRWHVSVVLRQNIELKLIFLNGWTDSILVRT
jgi:hypothetical protein